MDWLRGQKTGFFVDQRDNRELLRRYSAGRRVLNMFCYTGGFSVYSLAGGAESVHSFDSSAKAVSLTDANVSLNFDAEAGARHRSYAEDAFKFLDNMEAGTYDLIVLDPPAFAKHRGAIRNALRGYQRINFRAFEKIAPAAYYSHSHVPRQSAKSNSVWPCSLPPRKAAAGCAYSTS